MLRIRLGLTASAAMAGAIPRRDEQPEGASDAPTRDVQWPNAALRPDTPPSLALPRLATGLSENRKIW
jgi:hypothetical protein